MTSKVTELAPAAAGQLSLLHHRLVSEVVDSRRSLSRGRAMRNRYEFMKRKAFVIYSGKDRQYRDLLFDCLSPLSIAEDSFTWHDQEISAGDEWTRTVDAKMGEADIVILLLSCAFFASEFCWCKQLQAALAQHAVGKVRIVPVVCRPVDWEFMSIGKLQGLPSNGKAIAEWMNRELAFKDVSRNLWNLLGPEEASLSRQITIRLIFDGDESDCQNLQQRDAMQTFEEKLAQMSGDSSLRIISVSKGSVVVDVTCEQSKYDYFSFLARYRRLKDKVGLMLVDAYCPSADDAPHVYTSPAGGLASGYVEESPGNGTAHCHLSSFHGIELLANLCRDLLPEPTPVLEDSYVLISRRGRMLYAQSNLKIPGQEYSPKILTTKHTNALDILKELVKPYGLFDERRIQRAHAHYIHYLVDEELKQLSASKRLSFQGAKFAFVDLQPDQ